MIFNRQYYINFYFGGTDSTISGGAELISNRHMGIALFDVDLGEFILKYKVAL